MMEKRLLNMRDFAKYAGGISRNSASKLAEASGACVRFGRRVFVDIVAFDAWLDEQRETKIA